MKNLLKTTVAVLVIMVICGIAAIWRPITLDSIMPLLGNGAALTVNTPQGKAEVFFDGKKVGETPYSAENLSAGDITLELRRISHQENFYEPVSKQIHLESNTRTFVEAEIGPGSQFSSVTVLYYRKNSLDNASFYAQSEPRTAEITIDDEQKGPAPFSSDALTPGRHTIRVEKQGFLPGEAVIIIREGYTLIGEFQLMAIPIDLNIQK
ncbi:MAG: PEGA domain-containing protein [Candidatus Dojkabacteria bacterium]|nr:PEGA domain-containing protein [Candidatus Dojkabacteria bacterium]